MGLSDLETRCRKQTQNSNSSWGTTVNHLNQTLWNKSEVTRTGLWSQHLTFTDLISWFYTTLFVNNMLMKHPFLLATFQLIFCCSLIVTCSKKWNHIETISLEQQQMDISSMAQIWIAEIPGGLWSSWYGVMRGDSNKREHPSRGNQLLKSHFSTLVIFSPLNHNRKMWSKVVLYFNKEWETNRIISCLMTTKIYQNM